ncbi:MAG: TetR/AcrR family transcriptional regulator [Rhodobiaceae bacterium]|nr:putative HTH-type transcriptional regulator YfiR [Rhodobiaceae bacterium]MCR9241847.1 TetR/AcrR family transcriptional regulator [Rhodobiaceae bacterium]
MRYSSDHKTKTRSRILEQAGLLFRRKGFNSVGIDEIMGAAKLTRGGFYGYFKSKAELLTEIVRDEAGLGRMMRRREGTTPAALHSEATETLTGYLDPKNANVIAKECTLASLPSDVTRSNVKPAKDAYTEKILELAHEYDRTRTGTTPEPGAHPSQEALAAVVLSIGGFSIARAMNDEDLSTALLDAARDKTLELLK